jgi:hypothetical protein
MLFEDERHGLPPMTPPPRRTFFRRHPSALTALLALIGAVGFALVGFGTLYASELEPCLRTDGGSFGNCGDSTGAFVVFVVLGIPALASLVRTVLRDRRSDEGSLRAR